MSNAQRQTEDEVSPLTLEGSKRARGERDGKPCWSLSALVLNWAPEARLPLAVCAAWEFWTNKTRRKMLRKDLRDNIGSAAGVGERNGIARFIHAFRAFLTCALLIIVSLPDRLNEGYWQGP